ncbi:MAG TPA: zinc-binding alcohol dehydrogenase [Anaerolineales bacterium]|nr:zinc-binding alcohol dehydrogenase [Anaerolineales bacterium]
MKALYFVAPREVEIREEPLPEMGLGQLAVQTLVSAISPGTEMLVFRGEMPQNEKTDATIAALTGEFRYPLKYGYASVGRVMAVGQPDLAWWKDRLVFSFQPHQTHFLATPAQLFPLPDGITPEQAVFLPNMETAVNFVMDGRPLIGERIAVFGQGIVGLLTTALLAQFPLANLTTFDYLSLRRNASFEAGAHSSVSPDFLHIAKSSYDFPSPPFDLTYELTGSPEALNDAIAVTGFDGRVVIGSWYGQKRAPIDLGGYFHRARIQLIGSQVSTLAPQFSGRWDKARRFEVAWEMIRRVKPEKWITHRFPFARATEAFEQVDQPTDAIQVILTYEG